MRSSFFRLVSHHLPGRVVTEKEKQISRSLAQAASRSATQIYADMNSNPAGLDVQDAKGRLQEYGRNTVVQQKMHPWYIQLLLAFKSPFNFVLFALAAVSYFTHDLTGMAIIIVMVLVSVFIKFIQEYKSGKGAEALRKMVTTTVTVLRSDAGGNSCEIDIPLDELVPGDVVHLAAGDIIPADLRLIHCKNLFISQSALTGESMPIEKEDADIAFDEKANALELKNICFMGTSVNTGTATAVVLATGAQTYFGSMAESLMTTVNRTSFDIGISKVSWLLIGFMAVMVPVVFFISGFTKGNWLEAMMFALSVAVGLTPEMLPMIMTSNMAKGAIKMAKEKVIVKKLSAIQDFGAMNILCTDKTGTLTEDRIVLMRYTDIFLDDSPDALRYAFLNSHFETGMKNVMDMAIIQSDFVPEKDALIGEWQDVDELPYDFERRRMSVILTHNNEHVLICKGAVEEMTTCCAKVSTPDGEKDMTPELKQTIADSAASLNRQGLRVIAVGHRCFPTSHSTTYTTDEERELVLDGFMSFLDPPKESARAAIKALESNGIRVIVLTGDNDVVAQKICSDVGLDEEHVVLGSEIEDLDDAAAAKLIDGHRVFAKLSPMQKSRIVTILKGEGNVVGYMGDGINDAMSLREADIGISVDTAVNIAKTSADIILLQKSLAVLNQGVMEGRKMFANTMKYIKITASSNFGNAFSMLGASALFPFLPMLPIQILILNLMYDVSQIAIPWDNVDADYLKQPRKWSADDIRRFMLVLGPVSSVFDYAMFGILALLFSVAGASYGGMFQTGWFVMSLCTQMLVLHVLRTEKVPFFRSNASPMLIFATISMTVAGIALTYTGIGHDIGFVSLPWRFYPWMIAVLVAYCLVSQVVKRWYIGRFKSWI